MKAICYLHNGEKNGANYCAYHLLKEFSEYDWHVYLKKPGAIEQKFTEELGITTSVKENLSKEDFQDVSLIVANTIMNFDVVNLANELGIGHLWVIHENFSLEEKLKEFDNSYQLRCLANFSAVMQAFTSCNHIVFVSEQQKNTYQRYISHSRTSVIYNGIDIQHWEKRARTSNFVDVRSKYGIGKTDLLVIQVGTVGHRKNQLATIEIARRLPESVQFLIIGARYVIDDEIKYLQKMNDLITQYKLENRVRILDLTDLVEKYYLSADVLLCTSYNEALPLSICEAMLFKLPVVSSNVNGIPEVVKETVGFMHDPDDIEGFCQSLMTLSKNKTLRLQLGEQAKELIQDQFNFTEMLRRYRMHFKSVTEKGFVQDATE